MASMDLGDGPRGGRGPGQWQNNRGGYNRGDRNNYNSNRNYNPNSGAYGGNSGYNKSGYNTGSYNNQYSGNQAYAGRQSWGGGSRGRGRGRGRGGGRTGSQFNDPEDIKFVKSLKGHTKKVTAVAINPDDQQIYTGSADSTLRVWNMTNGESMQTIAAGGEVDSMLLSGKMLIVGLHVSPEEGMVRAWNIDSGADVVLPGRHRGPVLCLTQANIFLMSGGQDAAIKVWQFDATAQAFQPLIEFNPQNGGHDSAVQALTVDQQHLYSADWHGNIKVFSMQPPGCVQTIANAHGPSAAPNYAGLIMGLLSYQGYLLSCALDGSVRVWAPNEPAQPNAVLEPTPNFSHPSNAEDTYGGVLAMCGVSDNKQQAVVLTSHSQENIIRLHGLPDFDDRGRLSALKDARALAAVPGGLIVAGDAAGTVKLWQWR